MESLLRSNSSEKLGLLEEYLGQHPLTDELLDHLLTFYQDDELGLIALMEVLAACRHFEKGSSSGVSSKIQVSLEDLYQTSPFGDGFKYHVLKLLASLFSLNPALGAEREILSRILEGDELEVLLALDILGPLLGDPTFHQFFQAEEPDFRTGIVRCFAGEKKAEKCMAVFYEYLSLFATPDFCNFFLKLALTNLLKRPFPESRQFSYQCLNLLLTRLGPDGVSAINKLALQELNTFMKLGGLTESGVGPKQLKFDFLKVWHLEHKFGTALDFKDYLKEGPLYVERPAEVADAVG